MFVFLDRDEDRQDIKNTDRLEFITLGRRMEFQDCVDHANANLEPGSIFTILNLDIFLADSPEWHNLDQEFFQTGFPLKSLVCKRHNLTADLRVTLEQRSWEKGEFSDAWTLKTPLLPEFLQEDFHFCVGNAPQCDNVMMYLMTKHYHTFSWGMKYKVYHLDVCRKQGGETVMIKNHATDYRASQRKQHHLLIPAFQDWQNLLDTQQPPISLIHKS